jgi:outer membrane protein assembly factor BamB
MSHDPEEFEVMMRFVCARRVVVAAAILACLAGADWTRYRGPNGSGVSDDKGLPTTWSASENIVWKTDLPGAGSSSPMTLGDKIYITCYSGYAQSEDDPGDIDKLERHLLCLRQKDGHILWDKAEKAKQPETAYKGFVALHGYASATPTTDGQTVYVFYGKSGAMAYGLDGKKLWETSVGDKVHAWGSAASPILWKDLLFVNGSVESGTLYALDKKTGKEVWKASGIVKAWSTPVLVTASDGKEAVVVSVEKKVLAFDPASGKQLWECAGVEDYICPSPIAQGDVVFATGARKPQALAVRAGGQGDVTKTHRLWEIKLAPKVPTPVWENGLLHWVDEKGTAVCVKADSGETVYREPLNFKGGKGDKVYSSLVLADGKLFCVSREGGAVVMAAGPQFKEFSRNEPLDPSIFNGTPTICNSRLLIRSYKTLYCIGK